MEDGGRGFGHLTGARLKTKNREVLSQNLPAGECVHGAECVPGAECVHGAVCVCVCVCVSNSSCPIANNKGNGNFIQCSSIFFQELKAVIRAA